MVGLAEGGDGAFGTAFGGAEGDEEHLVFALVDEGAEFVFEAEAFVRGEVALEDGELEVIAPIEAGFVDAAEAAWVADVVANDVGGAHGFLGSAMEGGRKRMLLAGERCLARLGGLFSIWCIAEGYTPFGKATRFRPTPGCQPEILIFLTFPRRRQEDGEGGEKGSAFFEKWIVEE